MNDVSSHNRLGVELFRIAMAVVLTAFVSTSASAQQLSEVQKLAENANFDGASAMLEEIEKGNSLRFQELPEFLELRALVAFATQDEERLTRALRRLRALSPTHSFSVSAPPSLVERFVAMEAPPAEFSLQILAEETDSGVVLKVEKQDPLDLARATIVRTAGPSEAWMPYDGRSIALNTFRYFAVLEGPGGAQLASVGSARAPRTYVASVPAKGQASKGEASKRAPTTISVDEDDAQSTVVWPWILTGVLVVAAGAIVAGFALSEENTVPVVSEPMFEN